MEDISIERIRETQSLGQKFNYMFKFEMVCLPTLFKKEVNAPPVSKLCLLVISKNRKKAFRGLKTKETLTLQDVDKSGMVGGCKNWR